MYLSQHLIKTSAVLHPIHDELIISHWKVSGQRASITFSDNGSRGARGMTPHADIDMEFLVPLTGHELRAMLFQHIETTLKRRN